MCEIVRRNFEENYTFIESAIKNADFIAFDTEFTGLTASNNDKNSLFDTPEARYQKLRQSVSQLTLLQFGLSAFTKDTSVAHNNFLAQTFNFYLYPANFGPLDSHFLIQASCGHFLAHYKFDFNKFFYEGIPYLNEEQENVLNQYLQNPRLFCSSRFDFEHELQECCSLVSDWLFKTEDGSQGQSSLLIEIPAGVTEFLLLLELRNRFPQIWTTVVGNKIEVSKVTSEENEKLLEVHKAKQLSRIHDQVLGFTCVFRLLVKYRKPLVGHNIFMDLLFIYEKFYKRLPRRFNQFKADIHRLFPVIIDTKRLSLSLKSIFENTRLFDNTVLLELHKSLLSLHTKSIMLYSPALGHAPGFDRYNNLQCPHEAGYDAFMCGRVLLLMAHLLASNGLRSEDMRHFHFREYLVALRPYVNLVNVIRAATNTVKLDGKDPEPVHPTQWLFVEVLNSSTYKAPVASQLTELLAQFGSVDIQLLGKRSAIVATSNPKCAKDILTSLKGNKHFRVAKYNTWRHDPWCRTAMWVGAAACGSVCVWLLWSAVLK